MPMLIPDHNAVESISKNGIDIDKVVRDSLNCAVKNSNKFIRSIQSQPFVQSPTLTQRKQQQELKNRNQQHYNLHQKLQQQQVSKKPLAAKNFQFFVKSQQLKNTSRSNGRKMTVKPSFKNIKDIKIKKENNSEYGNFKAKFSNSKNELDDSLTSLLWLTDVKVNDIMEGRPIQYTPLSPAPSTDGEEQHSGRSSRYHSDSSVDYRKNNHVKPPYSYAALIIMAMKTKVSGKMTLSEIYKWITDNFVFYKSADPSWQNSIRHNLSLNKCFAKLPRNKGDPGKGGYWRVVPEYANKLLETNIRKRRTSMIDYNCQEFIKRQKLELFESQYLLKVKEETHGTDDNNNSQQNFPHKIIYKHGQCNEVFADAEQCRMDHPYGKNPCVKYETDEETIKALADNLQKSSTTFIDPSLSTSSINFDLSTSQIFNSSSVIRTDCIWSSEQNLNEGMLTESMTRVEKELLEARNMTSEDSTLLSKTLTNSLNSSGGFTTTLEFCLSPPLSGDDENLSADDIDEDLETPFEGLDLTIHGTSMHILEPTEDTEALVKEEPLSPESIDLVE